MEAIFSQNASLSARALEGSSCSSSSSAVRRFAGFWCPQPCTGPSVQPRTSVTSHRPLWRQWTMVAHAIKSLTDAENEELLQYKDRDRWYLPSFAADDAPDWNQGRFVRSRQLAPGIREITVEAEISREQIPLRNAYRHVGQKASIRVNSGIECTVPVAAGPFPQALIKESLFRARGDMTSGEIKQVKEVDSVKAELPLFVAEDDAPDLYKMAEDDAVEIGPFVVRLSTQRDAFMQVIPEGAGMDLRGPIVAMYQFPTIVIFCEGQGIATAKALLETGPAEGGLNFPYREDVRMYYRAPNQEALCYKDRYEEWEQNYCCKIITSTRDTFQDMFDDDNTLAYEPESTAAVILCGSDEEAEAAALEVCKEAEITEIAIDSREQTQSVYITKGSEGPIVSDKKKADAAAA